MGLLTRPDVMAELSDWRGGQALGLRTQMLVTSSSALALITVPKADPRWYVRGGAAIERFWLSVESEGLAAQPVSPLFLYATSKEDLSSLGGERYLDEMYRPHANAFARPGTWKMARRWPWCCASFTPHRPACEASGVPSSQVLRRTPQLPSSVGSVRETTPTGGRPGPTGNQTLAPTGACRSSTAPQMHTNCEIFANGGQSELLNR